MSVSAKAFGKTKNGEEITAYTIANGKGMEATVINFGAILTQLKVQDRDGKFDDVVLGYDTVADYEENGCFFGSTVGRSANRIAGAKFELDGVTYNLDVNDGPNNLHSQFDHGFHKRVWEAKAEENGVVFFLVEQDGANGFPGKLEMSVTYTLTEDNALCISYCGVSDKKTLINCTNHSYFNLTGHASGKNIHDHKIQILASRYTPVVEGAIPTGEWAPVEGTPFDLRSLKRVGEEIDSDCEQLKLVKGYDHNFCIDNADHTSRLIARVEEDTTGRVMEVFSDLPGVQFYAGNCIEDTIGKDKTPYTVRSGLCLETQYFPNSINQEGFEHPIYDAGQEYMTTTSYRFSVK